MVRTSSVLVFTFIVHGFLMVCTRSYASGWVFTLEQAVAHALSYSTEIDRAGLSIQSAKICQGEAERQFHWRICPQGQVGVIGGGEAGEGPSLGGGFEIVKEFASGTRVFLRPNITRASRLWTSNAQARITQPLLRGISRQHNLTKRLSADFEVRSAIRAYYIAQVHVIERTIKAVFELRQAQDNVTTHKDLVQRLSQVEEASYLKQHLGMAAASDLYQSRMELVRGRDALEQSEATLCQRSDAVKELLGMGYDNEVIIDVAIIWQPVRMCTQEAIDIALRQRIEIIQAEDELQEAIRNSRVDRHRMLPDLNLVFDYANCGNSQALVHSCLRDRVNTWSIGLSSSGELSSSKANVAYQQGLLRVRQAELSLVQKQAAVAKEVRCALEDLHRSEVKIAVEEEKIQTAHGKLEHTRLRFRHGMIGHLRVLQALRELQKAQSGLQSAIIKHLLAEYRLQAAIGSLADIEACLI